jgi:hypothetical protein
VLRFAPTTGSLEGDRLPHAPARRTALLLTALLVLTGCGGDDTSGGGALGRDRSTTTATPKATGSAAGATTTTGAGTAAAPADCSTTGGAAGTGETVPVDLDEWSVTPVKPSVKAGTVTFTARNAGRQPHELVVIAAPSPSGLPLAPDGSVAEGTLQAGALTGRITGVGPGKRCSGSFQLEAGTYTVICNLVAGGAAHYGRGMINVLSVS